jgi:DNA-binding transcriptional LysR family regulator
MDKARAVANFLVVARSGSFSQAAIEAGVTPQAMSKTVRQLEEALGVRLIHRTTRKLSLTEEGQQLCDLAEPGLRILDEALNQVQHSRQKIEGLIRLSGPTSVGLRILVPMVREFRERYPAVQFDLQLDDHFTDLIEAKIDVGFRAGTAPERNLIVRRLRGIKQIICASPDYLERHGKPESLEDLLRHRCTGFRHPNTGRVVPWELQVGDNLVYQDVPAIVTFNNVEAEVEAVRSGIGIGQLTGYMVEQELANGTLVPVLPELATERLSLYMFYPQRKQIAPRVRAFIDFAMEFHRS